VEGYHILCYLHNIEFRSMRVIYMRSPIPTISGVRMLTSSCRFKIRDFMICQYLHIGGGSVSIMVIPGHISLSSSFASCTIFPVQHKPINIHMSLTRSLSQDGTKINTHPYVRSMSSSSPPIPPVLSSIDLFTFTNILVFHGSNFEIRSYSKHTVAKPSGSNSSTQPTS